MIRKQDKTSIKFKLKKGFTPARLILLGFLSVILFGSFLLSLPFANANHQWLNFTDALFTATSATCVTGLAVYVTSTHFTIFGQIVILGLIQIGGLGIMTISSALYFLVNSRSSTLHNRLTLTSEYSDFAWQDFRKLLRKLFSVVIIIELIGAILLTIFFSRYFSAGKSVWYGIFHSISAFCNAGFDIVSLDGSSMYAFRQDPFVLLTLSMLIIFGGIGFVVIIDMFTVRKLHRLKLQSKIVIPMTITLLLVGMAVYLGVEWTNPNTIGSMSVGNKFLNAFFQSTTTRTAGFSAISQSSMRNGSIPMTIGLMFVGASPGSTGGGLKTTTLFVLLASVLSALRQKKGVIVDMHKIGKTAIKKATTMLMLALIIQGISMFIVILSEASKGFSNQQLIFEIVSAYATVGLSMDVTNNLSVLGKFIVILNMFIGRVGTFTFFIAFTRNHSEKEQKIKYPEANISF